MIGLAAVAIPAAIVSAVGRAFCKSCQDPSRAALEGGALGVAIGVGIDAAVRKTFNLSPTQGTRFTVSPVIRADRQAVLVSVRF